MGSNNERQCGGIYRTRNIFAYNARYYNHYTVVGYPDLTISGSRSYPKKALAENIL
jgi:hypothetical protein